MGENGMNDGGEQGRNILEVLDGLGIAYTHHEHEAAFTVEDADRIYGHLEGGHLKNLFLRNKKGDRHYLVVVESHKQVDLKALRGALGESTLSFASPERLLRHMGLTPGSVSPMGLINDTTGAVTAYFDQDLLGFELLNFHPNRNTATITVRTDDLKRFVEHTGRAFQTLEIPT